MGGGAAGLGATAALLEAARFQSGIGTWLAAACWIFFPAASAWLAARFAQAMPAASIPPAWRRSPLLTMVAALIALLTFAALVLAKAAEWRIGK
jgi:xanthine/uracil permease